jgi:Undecaprenyl-phosphate galactose phosphotransferase WbaP
MDLEGRLALRTSYHLLDQNSIILKRVFDLAIGFVLAIISLPLLVIIALLIKLESPGPAFYRQERLGQRGKTIHYLKFRTMRLGAEDELEQLLKDSPAARQEFEKHHKLKKDPRVTRVGRFLRKFSLDELPQFWHVLQGEMSLVGPRAYMTEELKDIGDYAPLILQVRPGVTGWWQVMGRHATTFQRRLQLDEYYISNWSIWLDIYILLKTIWVIASGVGA